MGAVIASREIYHTFMACDAPEYMVEFPHGYTYSAHPVACAAALAALDVLEKESMIERVQQLAPYFEDAVHGLRGRRYFTDIRNYGLAAGFTLEPYPGEPARRPFEVAHRSAGRRGFTYATVVTPCNWHHRLSPPGRKSTPWSMHWARQLMSWIKHRGRRTRLDLTTGRNFP